MKVLYECERGHKNIADDNDGETTLVDSMRCLGPTPDHPDYGQVCPHTMFRQSDARLQDACTTKFTANAPTSSGPLLADVGLELGLFIGELLPGMQQALDDVCAHRWPEDYRDSVISRVGGVMVDHFDFLSDGREQDVEQLEAEAEYALALYIAAKSRAVVKRQRQARQVAQATARARQ